MTRLLRSQRELNRGTEKPVATAEHTSEDIPSAVRVVRHVSPQVAAALLSKPGPRLDSRQSEMVDNLKRNCPGFATMRHLVLSFRSILCGGKASSLKHWVEKAEATGIEPLSRFVLRLEQDWSAVENAVEQVWSNGPAEGHINVCPAKAGVFSGSQPHQNKSQSSVAWIAGRKGN